MNNSTGVFRTEYNIINPLAGLNVLLIFPKTKKDLVVLSRQCCLFCLVVMNVKNVFFKSALKTFFSYFSVLNDKNV